MRRRMIAAVALLAAGTGGWAQDMPFGTDADTDYAGELWTQMVDAGLAGDDAIASFPYPGTDPHGMMLMTFYDTATVGGHEGDLVVKRNFGPEGVTGDEALASPDEHLASVTVMFRREEGYDPDNANWFWAKYLADGSLDANADGVPLAGRVAKGADQGCIACHAGAGGGDYLFTTDHLSD